MTTGRINQVAARGDPSGHRTDDLGLGFTDGLRGTYVRSYERRPRTPEVTAPQGRDDREVGNHLKSRHKLTTLGHTQDLRLCRHWFAFKTNQLLPDSSALTLQLRDNEMKRYLHSPSLTSFHHVLRGARRGYTRTGCCRSVMVVFRGWTCSRSGLQANPLYLMYLVG